MKKSRMKKSSAKKGKPVVRVGAAAFALNSKGEVLVHRRHLSHGAGSWSLTGGHVEFGESPEHAAKREAFEELGIRLGPLTFVGVTNDHFKREGKHYQTFFFKGKLARSSARPHVREAGKLTDVRWVPLNALPKNCFLPIRNLKSKKPGVAMVADGAFVRKLKFV